MIAEVEVCRSIKISNFSLSMGHTVCDFCALQCQASRMSERRKQSTNNDSHVPVVVDARIQSCFKIRHPRYFNSFTESAGSTHPSNATNAGTEARVALEGCSIWVQPNLEFLAQYHPVQIALNFQMAFKD